MANHGATSVVCPFYLREAHVTIVCESPICGNRITSYFDTPEEKIAYRKANCESYKYGKCGIAKLNAEKQP